MSHFECSVHHPTHQTSQPARQTGRQTGRQAGTQASDMPDQQLYSVQVVRVNRSSLRKIYSVFDGSTATVCMSALCQPTQLGCFSRPLVLLLDVAPVVSACSTGTSSLRKLAPEQGDSLCCFHLFIRETAAGDMYWGIQRGH
jgi:hypothetical protein